MEDNSFFDYDSKPESAVKTIKALTAKAIALGSQTYHTVEVVGFITNLKKTSSGFVFSLFDTTGHMDCALWPNSRYEELLLTKVSEKTLVRAIGSIKVFSNKKTLNISNLEQVDSNYLVYHLVSSLYQTLVLNKGLVQTTKASSPSTSAIENDILTVYRNNQDEDGLDIETVISMLKKYKEKEVRNTIESLLDEGHLYSVEGTNYKTTI